MSKLPYKILSKFPLNWPSGYRGKDLYNLSIQKQFTSGNQVFFIDQNKVNNFHREPSIKYFCKAISKEVINGKY